MKNKWVVRAAATLSVILIFPAFCFAFNTNERMGLLKDAIRLSPPELRTVLEKWESAVMDGMKMVDGNPFVSLKPEDLPAVYRALVQRLEDSGPETYNTAHNFGILACFASEAVCPGPVFSGYDMTPELVTLDGFRQVTDPVERVAELVEKYRVPFYSDRRYEAVAYLYDVAVNTIVDFWVSAWQEAGNQVAALPQKGQSVSHAKKALYAEKVQQKEEEPEEKKKSSKGGSPTVMFGGMPGGMTVMVRSFK